MKRMLAVMLLFALLAVSLSACARKKTLEEVIHEKLDNVDENHVFQIRFDLEWRNGNTLCKNCDAINKGHVDICGFCGRRIVKS